MTGPATSPFRSLGVRVTVLLACLLSALLLVASVTIMRLWERSAIDAAISETERFADTIKRSAQHSMLRAQVEAVREIINDVGEQKDVEWVRIFNKEGKVIYSTNAVEIGTVLDKQAEACYRCHSSDAPLGRLPSADRSRIVESGGHRVLATVDPIANAPDCASAACHAHPESQKLLGVLDVAVSLEGTDGTIRSRSRAIAALGGISILAVSGIVALSLQLYVGRPVRRLAEATRRVSGGELDVVIPVEGRDELAELGAAFNTMTRSLERTSREVNDLNLSLERRVDQKTRELVSAQLQVARAERLAAVGRMAAGVAHELNNPLTGVLTFAHLLARKAPEGSRERADLETIIRETNRCARIIKELLQFSRESPPRRGVCQVNDLLQQTLRIVEHQADFQNIRIERRLAADLPAIVADAGQLEQVFLNIVVNAGQAMPDGGALTISTRGVEGALEVSIADTGCGIRPEDLGRIFDPFFTLKAPGQGTGLGLSVSHRLVENHGGSIRVTSEVGKGSTFTVLLPLEPSNVMAEVAS